MIRVHYDGNCFLEVQGHAQWGKQGEDLICAAVTALVLTLGESALRQDTGPGYARLWGGSREIYEAMARGFSLLAKNYPQHVHYMCAKPEK